MANAARVHAVENGEDLAGYTMIAFGGAAPLHAARLCEKLGVERLLVPPGAGVGSAIGFLRAPFSFEATRSLYMRLSDFDAAAVADVLRDLETEAAGFVRSCDATSDILSDHKVFMRYTGQGWEIPVSLPLDAARNPDAATYLALFEAEYAGLFGRTVTGMDVEITVWAVNAATPSQPVTLIEPAAAGPAAEVTGTRTLFDPALAHTVDAVDIHRHNLTTGNTVQGPAAITEDETTIILPSSRRAVRQSDGCIDITPKEASS